MTSDPNVVQALETGAPSFGRGFPDAECAGRLLRGEERFRCGRAVFHAVGVCVRASRPAPAGTVPRHAAPTRANPHEPSQSLANRCNPAGRRAAAIESYRHHTQSREVIP